MQLLPKNIGPLAKIFAEQPIDTALSDGIVGGFAVIGYRGKTWSIRQGGNETPIMRDDGDGARNSLELVVVASSHVIAKTWYENVYTEGSNQPPDCFSNNGVAPDPLSTKKQNNLCATCRHNVIGSFVNPTTGKKAKSCHDRKRMAVVPANDLRNEFYGGPMLLTAPPTSLGVLLQFDLQMRAMGYPYYSYITQFAFEVEEAYPRFKLAVVRSLTEEEAAIVNELRHDPRTERILAETNSFDDGIEDIVPDQPDATVVPIRPQQPAPTNAPHSPPASAAPPQPAQAAPQQPAPKKRQGRPSAAAKAAAAAAQPAQQPAPQRAPQQPARGFGGPAPAPQQAAPAATEEVDEVVIVEDELTAPNERLDALLDNLLPQGNA